MALLEGEKIYDLSLEYGWKGQTLQEYFNSIEEYRFRSAYEMYEMPESNYTKLFYSEDKVYFFAPYINDELSDNKLIFVFSDFGGNLNANAYSSSINFNIGILNNNNIEEIDRLFRYSPQDEDIALYIDCTYLSAQSFYSLYTQSTEYDYYSSKYYTKKNLLGIICDMIDKSTDKHFDSFVKECDRYQDDPFFNYLDLETAEQKSIKFPYNYFNNYSPPFKGRAFELYFLNENNLYEKKIFIPQYFSQLRNGLEIIRIDVGKYKTNNDIYILNSTYAQNVQEDRNPPKNREDLKMIKNNFCFFPIIHNYSSSWITEIVTKEYALPSWSEATDEEIEEILSMYYDGLITKNNIKKYWKERDTRIVHLSAMSIADGVDESHREQDVEMILTYFQQDNTPNLNSQIRKSHLLTIVQKDPLMDINYAKGLSNINTEIGYMDLNLSTYSQKVYSKYAAYDLSSRSAWCNNTYFNALPDYLKKSIKEVKVTAGLDATGIYKCFLPDYNFATKYWEEFDNNKFIKFHDECWTSTGSFNYVAINGEYDEWGDPLYVLGDPEFQCTYTGEYHLYTKRVSSIEKKGIAPAFCL